LKCGDLVYTFDPAVDNYMNFKTIFTSEEAALVMCEVIYKNIEDGVEFFDHEFGPKDSSDLEGSKRSMYFDENIPGGYIPPEQIEWRRPEEYLDKG
jgi:hypothetical protein